MICKCQSCLLSIEFPSREEPSRRRTLGSRTLPRGLQRVQDSCLLLMTNGHQTMYLCYTALYFETPQCISRSSKFVYLLPCILAEIWHINNPFILLFLSTPCPYGHLRSSAKSLAANVSHPIPIGKQRTPKATKVSLGCGSCFCGSGSIRGRRFRCFAPIIASAKCKLVSLRLCVRVYVILSLKPPYQLIHIAL